MAEDLKGSATFSRGSESFFELFCQPCSEDRKHLEAHGFCQDCQEFLCRDCYDSHRKPRPTRHHILLTKDEMPKTTPPSKGQGATDACTERCEKHPNEVTKYHCPKHDVVVCGVCVTVSHITCGVDHIPDKANGIGDSDEYNNIYQTLVDMTKKISETIQQSKNNLSKMQGFQDDAMNNVQQIRKEMNDIMDMLERKIRTEAEEFKSADAEKMNSTVEQCNSFLKEIDAARTQLEKKKETKQECNLFIEMKRSSEKLKAFQRKLEDFQENNQVTDYAFDRSAGMWDLLNKTSSYGKLVQRHQSSSSPRCKTVNLERGSFGFGFSIVGGVGSQYGSKGGDVPIFVANVLPQSPAFKNGLLKRGHQILSVNGISLEGLTHDQAASILKNAKKSVILKVMDKQYTSCECAGKGRCLHCFLHPF